MAVRHHASRADVGGNLPVFERLAPAPPALLLAARIEAHTGPGDVVADLAGRGGWVARAAVDRLFRWRVTSFPAPELDFIRYVCMVDDARARSALGYRPRHDLLETLRAVDQERWQ